jgi:hypothetical protein
VVVRLQVIAPVQMALLNSSQAAPPTPLWRAVELASRLKIRRRILNQFFAGVGEARLPFTDIGVPKGWVTGSEYQQAEGAIKDIAASYLYSVSGATATPGEIAGTVERIMPKMGESADAVAEKKKRLTDMVNSIKLRASPQVLSQAAIDNPPPGKLSPEEQSELASLRARFKGR